MYKDFFIKFIMGKMENYSKISNNLSSRNVTERDNNISNILRLYWFSDIRPEVGAEKRAAETP